MWLTATQWVLRWACQRYWHCPCFDSEPKLVVCDEPVLLDVIDPSQVAFTKRATAKWAVSLVLSHTILRCGKKHISDRVLVMYLGNWQSSSVNEALYDNPSNPYTKALLSAVPVPDPKVERGKKITVITGRIYLSQISPPSGCVFRTRCPHANEGCAQQKLSCKCCPKSIRFSLFALSWNHMTGK